MQALAHELLDAGADLYWGHSNHTPQGIEIYNGKAILYSTGDFVDDYAIDRGERNDLSFLFMVDLAGGRTVEVRLYPTAIQDCRVRRARRDEAAFLEASMTRKCAAFQSRLEFEADIGTLRIG
jgi:poly-gamma-glutamate synthesis protein (capsule biosynthesis protein)